MHVEANKIIIDEILESLCSQFPNRNNYYYYYGLYFKNYCDTSLEKKITIHNNSVITINSNTPCSTFFVGKE